MSKSDVRKVAGSSSIGPSNGVTANQPLNGYLLPTADLASVREYLRYAVESISAVIQLEERCGNRAPIVDTLKQYAADARALLNRLA